MVCGLGETQTLDGGVWVKRESTVRPNILTLPCLRVVPFVALSECFPDRFPTISALAVCPLSESHLGKPTWSLFTYTSITTLSLGCPNWHMNGSVLPRERPSWRLQVSGYNDKEPQEVLGKTSYPLFRFSAHNFGSETRTSAVEGYAFWGQLNSLYESDGLRFRVVLEVCKRQIDPVIEYDRVHGPLIVKELPYLQARGRLTLLPVSQISSGQGGGVYDF
ncbi:hypothetical protein C8J56DRAFT_1019274 [Mycena floridula]|nr:hypothetical protein C8J56DRAFT_1019274 [Mycena floridula]